MSISRPLALAARFLSGTAVADDGSVFGSPERFQEQGGQAIFGHVCAGCHMPDAKGAKGAGAYPALAGNPRLEAGGYPLALVLHGQKAMPPLGEYLTDRQVADVVNYLRSHFGNDYKDAVTEADAKAARGG